MAGRRLLEIEADGRRDGPGSEQTNVFHASTLELVREIDQDMLEDFSSAMNTAITAFVEDHLASNVYGVLRSGASEAASACGDVVGGVTLNQVPGWFKDGAQVKAGTTGATLVNAFALWSSVAAFLQSGIVEATWAAVDV
jgi:hypothetical protein